MVGAAGYEQWLAMDAAAVTVRGGDLRSMAPFLVVVPHPDDETLGCGGMIARVAELGLPLRVVYLTCGGRSHVGSATWPPERLGAERRQEALRALAVLGVPSTEVHFLGWDDGVPLAAESPAFAATVDHLRATCREAGVRTVLAPWEGERHCDHRAAGLLARAIAAPPVQVLSYLVWGWGDEALMQAAAGRTLYRLECASASGRRRRALDCHRTQMTGLIADADQGFLLPAALAALTERPTEIYIGPAA
jgi:LmbE family N-acetylglucosaminyl deacetylase